MTPDGAGDQTPVLGRIDEAAIGKIQCLARGSEAIRRGPGFDFSFFRRAARTHFAVRQVDDRERNSAIAQEERDSPHAPFDIVGMRSEEKDVCRHRFHSGALDGGTMPFNRRYTHMYPYISFECRIML